MFRSDEDIDYLLNTFEDENYADYKCDDVRFPQHDNPIGDVIITYIKNDLK